MEGLVTPTGTAVSLLAAVSSMRPQGTSLRGMLAAHCPTPRTGRFQPPWKPPLPVLSSPCTETTRSLIRKNFPFKTQGALTCQRPPGPFSGIQLPRGEFRSPQAHGLMELQARNWR